MLALFENLEQRAVHIWTFCAIYVGETGPMYVSKRPQQRRLIIGKTSALQRLYHLLLFTILQHNVEFSPLLVGRTIFG